MEAIPSRASEVLTQLGLGVEPERLERALTHRYYAYEKFGVRQREVVGYSQAVRVGDRIEIAGQGMSRRFALIMATGKHDFLTPSVVYV